VNEIPDVFLMDAYVMGPHRKAAKDMLVRTLKALISLLTTNLAKAIAQNFPEMKNLFARPVKEQEQFALNRPVGPS
jgi:hypothetical protein